MLISFVVMPSAENRTLVVGVTALGGRYSDSIPTFAAGVLIATLPALLIHLFFQQHIADGITAGFHEGLT